MKITINPGNPKKADISSVKIFTPTFIPRGNNIGLDKYIIIPPSIPLNNNLIIFLIVLENIITPNTAIHTVNIKPIILLESTNFTPIISKSI